MTAREPVARLLLRAPNWLGDAVLAIPAMAALRTTYKSAHLTVAAPKSIASLFLETTPVSPEAVLELPRRHNETVAALANGDFDLCVLFPNSFRSAWQARRAQIPQRWGFAGVGRTWLLTRHARKPSRRTPLHQAEYYRALVRAFDVPCPEDQMPSVTATAGSTASADALLKQHRWAAQTRFIAIMPGAAYGEAKQWPAPRMAELAGRFVRQSDYGCVVLGAAHDRPAAREIESWLRANAPDVVARVLNLTGQTNVSALVGLLGKAALCVSNDSGGMHLAAALGRPVVAIFGPTDERVTRPLGHHDVITEPVFCRPCMLRDCPIDHRCMKRIGVDRVYDTIASRLAAAGAL